MPGRPTVQCTNVAVLGIVSHSTAPTSKDLGFGGLVYTFSSGLDVF